MFRLARTTLRKLPVRTSAITRISYFLLERDLSYVYGYELVIANQLVVAVLNTFEGDSGLQTNSFGCNARWGGGGSRRLPPP